MIPYNLSGLSMISRSSPPVVVPKRVRSEEDKPRLHPLKQDYFAKKFTPERGETPLRRQRAHLVAMLVQAGVPHARKQKSKKQRPAKNSLAFTCLMRYAPGKALYNSQVMSVVQVFARLFERLISDVM